MNLNKLSQYVRFLIISNQLLQFFLFSPLQLHSKELFQYGTPLINHFSKKDYKAGNQNWSITQDDDGFVYIGNSNGLLQYDGYRWKRFNLPSGTIVRSLLHSKGRIYSGSLGEMGYWKKDKNSNLKYTSLTALLEDHNFGDEEIWWIVEHQNRIYFQSFSQTFMYDGEKMKIILSGKGVLFPPFSVNGRLYLQILNTGLVELTDSGFSLLPGSEVLVEKRVNTMMPFSGSEAILIGTEDDGFYTLTNGRFAPWHIKGGESIIRDQVNRGIKISDQLFAIGTLLGGIYIVNEDGILLSQINKKNGLNNNTILSLFVDKKKNLWVGMDNGIDHIKVNAPIYYNIDVSGDIGSVYTSAIYKGDLYLGTNRGVFYRSVNRNADEIIQSDFKLIPGSQGQVWSLSVIDDNLFCGHNTSTFLIEHHELKKISNIAGGYQIKQYPYNERLIIQGSYTGLSVMKKENGVWKFSHSIPGFQKLSKTIEFERENVLWVAHTHKGLFRLELNDDLTRILEIRSFSSESRTYVNKLNRKVIISSDSGFLYYDDIQNTFFMLDEINNSLGRFAINTHVIPGFGNKYWLFKDGTCARAIMDETSVYSLDHRMSADLNEFLIPGYESLYVIDTTYALIHLDNGYAVYQDSWTDVASDYDPSIVIRTITFTTPSGDQFTGNLTNIPYRFNDVRVDVSYAEYSGYSTMVYKLEGWESERWQEVGSNGVIHFQNLPEGQYTLTIKRREYEGDIGEKIEFTIRPPWFKSRLAFTLYLIIGIISIAISILLNRQKIKRIYRQHEEERHELLRREAEENEKKLIKLRNENLRNEIKLRNSKLAKSTFSLIHKNNTLIAVKDELTKIKDELGVRFPTKHFNRLIRNIDQDITSEHDWIMFEQSFNEVHEHFLDKLKKEYPDLTPADIQLCAYLKMNLSSKEIASLLNITVRGVEIRRYRLRKKLQLEHDTNLTEFIMVY